MKTIESAIIQLLRENHCEYFNVYFLDTSLYLYKIFYFYEIAYNLPTALATLISETKT